MEIPGKTHRAFWRLLRPFFFLLPAEKAHDLAFHAMQAMQPLREARRAVSRFCAIHEDRLKSRVFGLEFPNPVGLAAGFDKDARLLPFWQALGFGFVETGTVTPLPQAGNPRPRLFRLTADEALINRMGFNNEGAAAVRERLLKLKRSGLWPAFPVGVNLGKNKATPLEGASQDYTALFDAFRDVADYLVINVSSPNTPGLRELQEKSRLDEIFAAIQQENTAKRPLLVKVAPDLAWSQLDDVLELCRKRRLNGIVATNTTIEREDLRTVIQEMGGLSGRPLRQRSTEFIRHIRRNAGDSLSIIGVGGISSAEDAYEKIRAGASLIQVYTGFVYQGPTLARDINIGLLALLQRDGFQTIAEAVGTS